MGPYDLKDAMSLLYTQTTVINGLWTNFIVATFAAGGFTAINGPHALRVRILIGLALTIAFGAFTIGNWVMIEAQLQARAVLAKAVISELSREKDAIKVALLTAATQFSGPVSGGRVVHFTIDACVLVAIWVRVVIPDADALDRILKRMRGQRA